MSFRKDSVTRKSHVITRIDGSTATEQTVHVAAVKTTTSNGRQKMSGTSRNHSRHSLDAYGMADHAIHERVDFEALPDGRYMRLQHPEVPGYLFRDMQACVRGLKEISLDELFTYRRDGNKYVILPRKCAHRGQRDTDSLARKLVHILSTPLHATRAYFFHYDLFPRFSAFESAAAGLPVAAHHIWDPIWERNRAQKLTDMMNEATHMLRQELHSKEMQKQQDLFDRNLRYLAPSFSEHYKQCVCYRTHLLGLRYDAHYRQEIARSMDGPMDQWQIPLETVKRHRDELQHLIRRRFGDACVSMPPCMTETFG
jgi:hypothetical protein